MAIAESRRQTCKVCGRRDKFDYHVPDELWRAAVPSQYGRSVVCLNCFDDFAHDRGVGYGNALEKLYFAGRAAIIVFAKI
jgi:hypothetical protein